VEGILFLKKGITENMKPPLHITQHKRFVPYGTHSNFLFRKNFFYAGNDKRINKDIFTPLGIPQVCTESAFFGA
jgi:hypothetical protein